MSNKANNLLNITKVKKVVSFKTRQVHFKFNYVNIVGGLNSTYRCIKYILALHNKLYIVTIECM